MNILSASLLHLLVIVPLTITSFVLSVQQPLCHNDESFALLEIKNTFVIDKTASTYPFPHSKVESWNTSDCCSWDGVECDKHTGHVIGLDLSSSHLYGSINSTSSLFKLSELQKLSLADNDFNFSRIPSAMGQLSRLTSLNLSLSSFNGQVPLEISQLYNLSLLDLSYNDLHGEFPTGIFQLPKLQVLNVWQNPYLSGHLPDEFHSSSALEQLLLSNTSISGKIPSSIGNLYFLQTLSFADCRFRGFVPSSLGRLTSLTYLDLNGNIFEGNKIPSFLQNLTQLTRLGLNECELGGEIPSWLGNLTQLTYLSLGFNKLHGLVPSSLAKLTKLTYLRLSQNYFKGQIPYFLQNLTQLIAIKFGGNNFEGEIPTWLGNLTQSTVPHVLERKELQGLMPYSTARLPHLRHLILDGNEFSGTLDIDMFLRLKSLRTLSLSDNKLSVLIKSSNTSGTFARFYKLRLASCNLTHFPDFLKYQDRLVDLDLHGNQMYGQIPKWIGNTGFIPWVHLMFIDLSFNKLQGQLPIPPPSTIQYLVIGNKLSGEVSPFFCNLSSLQLLDLSNNQLSGELPPCLKNLRSTLLVLNMSNNHFHGSIPHVCAKESNLRMIDLNNNEFQGRLPKMLAKCSMLEVLNLGNNRFNDVFPSWIGSLPKLRLLILRSNNLYGVITWKQKAHNPEVFSSLSVFDVSNNSFTGQLPSEYFKKWNFMKVKHAGRSSYLMANLSFITEDISWKKRLSYSIAISSKGMFILYGKIQEAFSVIDLSSNRFEGRIPDSLGNLQGLHVLNLSNNILTGSIPSSFRNITQLESLDLSHNKLSGEIPPELSELTFLAAFTVSHNHLTGHIPQGNQLETFGITSYEGNIGLCGNPLPNKCEFEGHSLPPSEFDEQQDSKSLFELYWMTIVPGYVCGVVIGIVVAQIAATKKHYWFVNTFGLGKLKGRKGKRGRR